MITEGDYQALDRSAMADLIAGKDHALNDLMDRHGQKLHSYLFRLLQNETEAVDITQETFARVYLNRARYNASFSFTSWLYTIATNLVKNRQRWFSRHPEVSLDSPKGETGATFGESFEAAGQTPPEALEARERQNLVRHAVQSLPEDLRRPLILAEYEQFSHKEISKILGCSPKAVETRVARARQRLKALLGDRKNELRP